MGDQLQEKTICDERSRRWTRNKGGVAACAPKTRGMREKSIWDLKDLSALSNSFVRCDAKRMTEPSRPFPPPRMEGQRWAETGVGVSEAVRFGSRHDTKATCSRSFQLSVKVRASGVRKPPANFFECPEPGSHRPRCPLCSYCDRISALFLPELQNVPASSPSNSELRLRR